MSSELFVVKKPATSAPAWQSSRIVWEKQK